MQAMRTISNVDEDGIVRVRLPASFGKRVELIILSLTEGEAQDPAGWELMKLQETSGFAANVLANPGEDVWNDV
jgi:hypothetical protein